MQFQLPQNLQVELLAYDPSLKKLTAQAKPKGATKKSKYPLGKPPQLIPVGIVKESDFNAAVETINANPASQRFIEFKRIVNDSEEGPKSITHAIVYHYEQGWYAAWLPPKGKEDEYVYGYSFAFKDTAASRKMLPKRLLDNIENYIQVAQGRTVFYTFKDTITQEDIINGIDGTLWNIPRVCAYYDKSRDIYPAIRRFENALKQNIPTWEDSRDMFERIKSRSLANILFEQYSISKSYWNDNVNLGLNNIKRDKNNWVPSYAAFQDLILFHAHTSGYDGENYKAYNKILHIIDTPFFRKWIQSKCDECNAASTDINNKYMSTIKRPWNQIQAMLKNIWYVNNIWNDCPVDYYQAHIKQLMGTQFRSTIKGYAHESGAKAWLQQHMPVASFFSILAKHYEKQDALTTERNHGYTYSSTLGLNVYNIHEWSDTLEMLSSLIHLGKEITPPKRWRLEEFHNHVQAEAWKVRNPNEKLPQDLFPQPVKAVVDSINWTFFQPMDTHQLAQWGQAVRNCVGSASNYAEGVRKKKHFIVLCMVDGRPQFTVQLDVNMGMMNVKQIAGISNSRLDDRDREQYTRAFAEALKQRSSELQSA